MASLHLVLYEGLECFCTLLNTCCEFLNLLDSAKENLTIILKPSQTEKQRFIKYAISDLTYFRFDIQNVSLFIGIFGRGKVRLMNDFFSNIHKRLDTSCNTPRLNLSFFAPPAPRNVCQASVIPIQERITLPVSP